MRKLVALMEKSQQVTADPQDVLDNIYDQFGDKVHIGAQKDLTEFYMIIVDLLDRGFKAILKIPDSRLRIANTELFKGGNQFKGKIVSEMFNNAMESTGKPQEEDLVALFVQPSSVNIKKALDEKFRYTIETEDSFVG